MLEADQNKLVSRLTRYICRIMIKIFSNGTLRVITNLPSKEPNNLIIKYFYYFLYSRILEREYINFLGQNDFVSAVGKKNDWANHILRFSSQKHEKSVAKHYLYILSKYRYADNVQITDVVENELKNIKKTSKEVFYLYGPNCKDLPDLKYKDCTLVVAKDIEENVEKFKDSILFLNHIYYRTKIENNTEFKNKLLNKYGKIYISSMLPIADKEFEHSKMLPSSELCGSMALGRMFYNLILKNGRFDCVIEGYDQYLETEAYSKHYPTLNREGNSLDEQKVIQSLSDHDALYNFLILKELSSYINFINSSDFKEIIDMSGNEYIKELVNARNFSLLA